MQLGDERESSNVEDRRGRGGGIPGGGIAVGGVGGVILVLVALFFGVDPSVLLNAVNGGPDQQTQTEPAGRTSPQQTGPQQEAQRDDPQRRFVAQVLASTEDVWGNMFKSAGRQYQPPTLVLFSGSTQSGCGFSQAQVGPFYCPQDQKVYLDLDFLRALQQKLGAQGDFARAYIVAHEVGHHVQNLLGIMDKAAAMREGGQATRNEISVRTELQADCFAGVWANRANQLRPMLEKGDIEQGLAAAAAVGDDRIQMQSRGYVSPESFTHGSAEQRARWFRAGLDSGDINRCNTFSTSQL